jgi:hypothetical protein
MGASSQGWRSASAAEAMATTPAATSRAETSFTGSGKRNRPAIA